MSKRNIGVFWKTVHIVTAIAMILPVNAFGLMLAPTPAIAATIGFNSPTAKDGSHDEWSFAERAFSSDNLYSTETTEDDDQSFEDFGFSIPVGSTIDGIEVKVEAKSSDTNGCQLEVSMWSESDNEHTDRKNQALTGTDTIYTLGSTSDLWGSTWTAEDFNDANFHAQVRFDDISGSSCDSSTVSLDHIQVKVHYTEPVFEGGIQIDTINNNEGPFNFSCEVNPLENGISITGSGSGEAPPGLIEQYKVQVDWGDGNVENDLGTFTPDSGQGAFTFTYSAGVHNYLASGTHTIKVRLYHTTPPGNDNQADSVASIEVCIAEPGPVCGNEIAEDGEQCDGIDGVGENQECSQECTLIDLPYCGDNEVNQESEQCDDGIQGSETCSVECTTIENEIELPVCGNEIIEEGEDCDDGIQGSQACTSECTTIEEVICDPEVNLVANGSFESPTVVHASKWDIFAEDLTSWITNWVSLSPGTFGSQTRPTSTLEIHKSGLFSGTIADGNQYAELDGDWGGPNDGGNGEPASTVISQILNTLPGYEYEINFDFSPRPNTGAGENVLEFNWDGGLIDSLSLAGGGSLNFQTYTYNQVATASSTEISFADGGTANSLGTFIDNVSVYCQGPTEQAYCGDGEVNQESEQCDDGVQGSQTCTSECTIIEQGGQCGDGVKDEGEWCDDGNTENGDGCDNTCNYEDLTCEEINGHEGQGWYAQYFNYSRTHADMNLDSNLWPDDGHGDPLSVDVAWDTDWYDGIYHKFNRIDSDLNFGNNFFPFDIAPEEIDNGHEHHFGVRWSGLATAPTDDIYEVEVSTDDDAWIYVDGDLVSDVDGIHAVTTEIIALNLTAGAHVIDVFFAERHISDSYFSFTYDERLIVTPYSEECPECGNFLLEEGNGEECDGGPEGSETCSVECTLAGQVCGTKFHDENLNQSFDEDESGLENWTIQLLQINSCEPGEQWADSVDSFSQGKRVDGTNVIAERSDSSQALGAAENDDSINFVSLGFDGEIVLQFDNYIVNQAGDDVKVYETSFSNPSCNDYPEKANVFASQDGSVWVALGSTCLDGTFDLGEMPWAQYIKIVDNSNKDDFTITADGFDVDAVEAINCASSIEVIDEEITDEEGNYCFEGVQDGDYRVQEVMQQGWINITSLFEDISVVDSQNVFVDFGNAIENPADQGQICGFKFYDYDQDGLFNNDDYGIEGWKIFANGGTFTNTYTNADGFYCFEALTEGDWDIYEELFTLEGNWATTTAATTTVSLSENEGLTNINFGNILCTDYDEDGYNAEGGVCGEKDCNDEDYDVENSCGGGESENPQCSDGINNDGEEDDLIDSADPGCHTDGDVENPNSYNPNDNNETDEPLVCTDNDSDGAYVEGGECGPSDCDDSDPERAADCGSGSNPPGGGGGGGGFTPLIISQEKASGVFSSGLVNVTITWYTNKPANSRVVYGTTSHNISLGTPPNYGYDFSTPTTDEAPKVLFHSVTINGLTPNTKYYFRPLSAASPEVYGIELDFTTTPEVTEEPETPSAPTSTPPTTPPAGGPTGGSTGPTTETGTVAGVEFVEEAQAQVVEEATSTEETMEEQKDEAPAPAEAKDCTVYLWILLILNLLAIAYAASKSKNAKNSTTKNAWWILVLLVVVPVVIAYPQCWLVIWLIITLIAAVILISTLTKKNEEKQA